MSTDEVAVSLDMPTQPGPNGTLVNAQEVVCRLCGSKILQREHATKADFAYDLPSRAADQASQRLSEAWFVADQLDFYNVGVTRPFAGSTTPDERLLTCADCPEHTAEPVGVRVEGRHYVYHARVAYR